jgi:hypothetical protein
MKIWIGIIFCLATAACTPKCDDCNSNIVFYPTSFSFVNLVGNDTLKLDSNYTNPFGENFKVEKCLYYISNVKTDTSNVSGETYFLVDQANPATKNCSFYSRQKTISSVSFLIGVDSIKNVTGAQTGALDPARSMFWTWNSGYIMAKLEGKSSVSIQVNNKFEYHIGGFSGPNNVLRRVTLTLPATTLLSKDSITEIVIAANIQKWFNGVSNLRITGNEVCTTPSALAAKYADNYATMFRILAVRKK